MSFKTYDTVERIYWTIGQVSEILEEPPTCIRYWCKCFDVAPMRSGKSRYSCRMKFTKPEIEKLKQIRNLLRQEHYTIKGAKSKLNPNGNEEKIKEAD